MEAWVSGSMGVVILIAAILCRKSKRTRSFSAAAFLSAGFFLAYTALAIYAGRGL